MTSENDVGEAFYAVRFIRDYVPGLDYQELRFVRKGEVVEVRLWLIRELIELGYVTWELEEKK